jgi:hypothetical protein
VRVLAAERQSDIAMPTLTEEAWAQMRRDYEHTDKPIQDICLEYGTTPNTLRDRVRRWGWTPRRLPIPDEGPPPLPAPQVAHAAPLVPIVSPVDTAAPDGPQAETAACLAVPNDADGGGAPAEPVPIARRLQAAVARVLPAIEATLGNLAASAHPREVERAARALAALTRTLRELNTLLSQHQAAAIEDDIPDIDAFRLDLARRIDLFVASRTGEDGDGAQPEA